MSKEGELLRQKFWEEDRIYNAGKMFNAYSEILNTILNRNEKTETAVEKQKLKLLEHAIATTEFYRERIRMKEGETVSLSKFPVINKQMIIENRKKFMSHAYVGEKLHEMHTSGSTGIPFTVQQNREKRLRVIAEIKALNEIAKYPSHEKMLYILGGHRESKAFSLEQQQKENIWRIPVGVNDDDTMKILLDFLLKEKPVAIHASASNLPPLVDYIKKIGISSDNFTVTSIITGGEVVPQKLRLDLKSVFGEKCEVYAKYSNEEMGILAMDSGLDTPYILNVANYYFEILKLDSDQPCEFGEMGRIVITDYYNYALPLIRYDTGDIGMLTQEDGKWPVLAEVSGKRRDLIFDTKGNSISGSYFTNTLKYVQGVLMWQLIQTDEKKYIYKIVPEDGRMLTDDDILLSDLKRMLGTDAEIEIQIVNEKLVNDSRKRRYTINLWRPQ